MARVIQFKNNKKGTKATVHRNARVKNRVVKLSFLLNVLTAIYFIVNNLL